MLIPPHPSPPYLYIALSCDVSPQRPQSAPCWYLSLSSYNLSVPYLCALLVPVVVITQLTAFPNSAPSIHSVPKLCAINSQRSQTLRHQLSTFPSSAPSIHSVPKLCAINSQRSQTLRHQLSTFPNSAPSTLSGPKRCAINSSVPKLCAISSQRSQTLCHQFTVLPKSAPCWYL